MKIRRLVVSRRWSQYARLYFGDVEVVDEMPPGRLGYVVYSGRGGRWRADIVPVRDVVDGREPAEQTPFRMIAWTARRYDMAGEYYHRWPLVNVRREADAKKGGAS